MKKSNNKKKQLILISLLVIVILYIITFSYASSYPVKTNIPIMDIKLNTETTLEQIHTNSKDIKYENNKMKLENEEYTITIKGRGHHTWNLNKRPYQIIFEDKTSLLDLPEAKKYVLLANYTDPSLLRNDFTFNVAKKLDFNYSKTGKYIDLYIDGRYLGNYYIIPKVAINKSSVDLKDDDAIIMELDNMYYDEEDYFITDTLKDHITVKDSQNDDYQTSLNAFKEKYNLMEKKIIEKDYDWLKNNIDMDSIAKFYLISAFAKNPDSVRSSIYFYMDGTNDKIHMGPIWDFDAAYGELLVKSEGEMLPSFYRSTTATVLFDKLLEIDEFSNLVSKYWKTDACRIYKEELDTLDTKIEYLKDSGEKNSTYWYKTQYKTFTDKFKDWTSKRYVYFNELFGCDYDE